MDRQRSRSFELSGRLLLDLSVSTSMSSPDLLQAHDAPARRIATSTSFKTALRLLLLSYIAIIVCPVRYWPFGRDADNTWFFALNYGAQHHLIAGRDIVWTTGPLAYLTVPQDIGNHLAAGLLLQTGLWLLVLLILWDMVFRGGLRLRSLAFFAAFLALASPVFQYPEPLGCADLLLAGALILLMQFQARGNLVRYVVALAMLGVIPLINFVGLMTAGGVILGLILYSARYRPPPARREIALAIAVPAFVAGVGYRLTLGSFAAFPSYFRTSLEVARGYSTAMSQAGPALDLVAASGTVILLGIVLWWFAYRDRQRAVFLASLTFFPFLLSFKHAFVRQDLHIMHFFCFAALLLALTSISAPLETRSAVKAAAISLLAFIPLWLPVLRADFVPGIAAVTGVRPLLMIIPALRFSSLHQKLDAKSHQRWQPEQRVEPEIRAIVQHDPVAFLSIFYSDAIMDDIHIVLYPVIVRHGAYTPFLDQMNAEWIRDKGPRFLIFDPQTIDGRHPWTETPAMWLEVYRWYNTRMVGTHDLLLERRAQPRFKKLEPLRRAQVQFGELVTIPFTERQSFWTLECSLTAAGKLRGLAFRIPEVTMTVTEKSGRSDVFRVLPAVLGAPSPGSYLPSTLAEFAEVFEADPRPSFAVEKVVFGGPGASAYARTCDFEVLQPSP